MSKVKNGIVTASANAFGIGLDLIGKECNGQKIVRATRKTMTLENGEIVDRVGAKVKFQQPPHDPSLKYCRRCKQYICECP